MKMRFSLLFSLILVLAIGLIFVAGCGLDEVDEVDEVDETDEVDEVDEAEEEINVGVIYSIVDPPRAGGWDRAQWVGHQSLEEEYGWDVSVAEGIPYGEVADTAAEYAERGFEVVIFPDAGMIDAWFEVAPQYPDTWFIMMSVTDELPDSDNVAAWSHSHYEYGVSVGITAAVASETNTIGLVGGMPLPGLVELFSGVIEGAEAVVPGTEVKVTWSGDWEDVAHHRELTTIQIQEGADVIFTITGGATTGVIGAAEDGGVWAIGYGADWYEDNPDAVLTSVVIETPPMYREMADMFLDGTLENKIYMLDRENFSLADFRGRLPEQEQMIKDTIEQFHTGELEVPKVIHDLD